MNKRIDDAKAIFSAGVRAVQADRLLAGFRWEDHLDKPLSSFGHRMVVGAGKASMAMAGAIEPFFEGLSFSGLVVVPHGYRDTLSPTQVSPTRIQVLEAGHPVPDLAGLEAAEQVIEMAKACGPQDLLVVLLSGGGSALLPAFAGGVTHEDAQDVFRLLLQSGADIQAINTVRKHLSRIGGGRLAALGAPATLLTLVLSDVVGDQLSVIASGPTVGDPTYFQDAIRTLQVFDIWEHVAPSVRGYLERGSREKAMETPKPEALFFSTARTILLGTNKHALDAAAFEARSKGFATKISANNLTGEAREVAHRIINEVKSLSPVTPLCLLYGGETTVTVEGKGKGGRNQELALAAAIAMEDLPGRIVLLSGGTDGIDGPTPAAGAWATPQTITDARSKGLEGAEFLSENDAFAFFERQGGLLTTGPTHTNVMDLIVVLIDP